MLGLSSNTDRMATETNSAGLARLAQAREERAVETLRVSEARYRRLFETAQDGILILDAGTGQVVDANPFLKELLGYSQEEFVGRKLWEIGPFKGEAASKNVFARLQAKDRLHYEGLPLETKDGRRVEVEFTSNAYEVDGTRFIHCNIRDLTDRKQSETKAAELAAIVESSDDAIIGKDRRGIITSWNAGAEKVFGYLAAEMVGHPVTRLLPAERVDEEVKILREIERGESVRHFETVRLHKDGSLLEVSVTVSAIRDSSGRIVGASNVTRDITEQKRQEKELKRSNEALERSNVDLAQFAYIASHDLQTPLRNISGFVQLLHEEYADKLDERAGDWIRRTVQAAEQMHTLIRDVLAYSRVDSQARPFEPVSLCGVFHDSVGLLEASIRDVAGEVTSDELPTVMGDRSQLVQLLQNLIGNGLKYHGEKPPHVHVSAQRDGKEWTISIRDNGIGIAPRHQERIFEIFKRLHNHQEYPGTGIGLAVCRRVVHRHGGKLRVESEAGHGSDFKFTIPETNTETP